MELVYLWVEEYKNIYKQGFNFSPHFSCEYDEEKKELTIDKNDDYIENFFGDKINVTAIVGKNGTGKSSILDCIDLGINAFLENNDVQFGANHPNYNKYILLYRHNSQYYNLGNILPNNENIIKGRENFNIVKNLLIQNHHNFLKLNKTNLTEIILDTFHTVDNNLINFFLPDIIVLNFLEYINQDISINALSFEDKLKFIVKLKFDEVKKKLEGRVKIDGTIISDYVIELENSNLESWKIFDIEIQILNNLATIDYFFNKGAHLNISNIDEIFYEINFKNGLSDEHKKLLLALNELNILEIYDSSKKEINDEHYNNFGINFNSLSSGEKSLLEIYLLLNKLKKSKSKGLKRLSIFLDEPENKLHPFWQKSFIHDVINIFSESSLKIDLFISSHSPFLLSDIPKQNIIFLDTNVNGKCKVVDGLNEKKQTFGANIHTLLSDSFFMKDGLMGEFAKRKIQEIMNFLNDEKKIEEISTKEEQIKQVIESIGEPFLKQKLLDMYYIKYKDESLKKVRKKELLAEQRRIEEELKRYD